MLIDCGISDSNSPHQEWLKELEFLRQIRQEIAFKVLSSLYRNYAAGLVESGQHDQVKRLCDIVANQINIIVQETGEIGKALYELAWTEAVLANTYDNAFNLFTHPRDNDAGTWDWNNITLANSPAMLEREKTAVTTANTHYNTDYTSLEELVQDYVNHNEPLVDLK